MKLENLDPKIQLILYIKATLEEDPKAVFCTSDSKLQAAGDELITQGKLIEIEGPGGKDRAFALPK